MSGSRIIVAALLLAMLAVGGVGGVWWIEKQAKLDAAAAETVIGGPFTLVAADGETVTDRTYRGKWMLVYFGYTFCPDACPTALGNISAALEKLGPAADKIQPLFITVDPRRDTPEVMGKYVKAFDRRIVGLSGTPEQIFAAVKAYGVYVAPQKPENGSYLVDHSSFVYLMDPSGKFVTTFSGNLSGARMAARLEKIIGSTS